MSTSSISERESHTDWASKFNKCFYQAEQQAKFMHLQEEVECLLQQLQDMKMQRISATLKED
ncbi:MAG: hypothetical protein SAK29_21470 [Scytonema sp. PMC 1069.18]|nr:hypothetical protein [Scytonema sp. PMC 1069.18]MEC4880509.1 hypothetical protein [Scytonema sp. PMC 1070.18]